VPGIHSARASLLPLAAELANLRPEILKELEHPASRYSVGWSRGKEQLNGKTPDLYKGSFYANPLMDHPSSTLPSTVDRHRSSMLPYKMRACRCNSNTADVLWHPLICYVGI
jgi:hypothetical protein